MADTDVKDSTDQVGSYEDDLAKRSTSDEEDASTESGQQDKPQQDQDQKKSSGRPSLRQTQKLTKGLKGPSGAGGASGAAAGEGAAAGTAAGAGAGGAAAGGAAASGGAAAAGAGAAAGAPVLLIVFIVVGVILLILIILIFILGGNAAALQNVLTITKTGPSTAAINDPLPYQINVAYPGTATDIVILDQIPAGTDYVDSFPPAKFDAATRTATWNLKDFIASKGGVLSSPSASLKINLKATADNSYLVNQAQGEVIGAGALPINPPGGGGPIVDGYVPYAPVSSNCGGKYDFSKYPEQNPLGNYGDPQCNFSKDNLYKLLQSKESNPEFVRIWFDVIVPEESGYSPQAWAPPVGQQQQLDAGGAWGLYQMGSSNPPGQAPPSPGQNGIYDRGDVNWEVQTSNAYNDWKLRNNCNFYPYWGSYQRSGLPNVNHC